MTKKDDGKAEPGPQTGSGEKERTATIGQPPPRPRGRFRRFVRSVFSHSIFAALVAGGALGYFFHGKILRDVGDRICAEDMLGRFMTKSASGVAPAPVIASTGASMQPDAAKTTMPAAAAAKKDEPVTSPSRTSPALPAGATPSQDIAGSTAEKKKAAAPVATATADTAGAGQKATESLRSSPESGRRQSASLTSAWSKARQAYAAGRPDAADAYKQLISRFPDVPGLTGELGNIYYRKGDFTAAAEQYYETGMRLIRANQHGRAACLLGVLHRLDSAKAQALSRQTAQPCPARRR